jgi:Domain of unknown function (DUF4394)
MRKSLVLFSAGVAAMLAIAPAAQGKRIKRPAYGLTKAGSLVKFDATNTSRAKRVGRVRGLRGGERLVGIDFRPRTRELVGLGSRSNIYALGTRTATAKRKSSLATIAGGAVRLSGKRFGIDFNPTVDRLRVVSDSGQNLGINVDTGITTVDGVLTYPPGDGSGGLATGVSGVAYTNNDNDAIAVPPATSPPGATGTQLFDIDARLDRLVLQNPPNAGKLNSVGRLENIGLVVGFDIYSRRNSAGRAVSNTAYASNRIFNEPRRLYKVDLARPKLTRVRGGGRTFSKVTDIAIRP